MRKLTDTYDIDNSFIDHALLFGDKPRTSDSGHGGMTIREREDGTFGNVPFRLLLAFLC